MRILLPSLLIFAAACTPTARELDRQASADAGARAALDRELAGLVPGRPQGCVSQTELREVKAYGDTLLYGTRGRTRYVNQTSGGCGDVGNQAILVTRTPSTQLCRGDIATSIDRASRISTGSCSFGDFVPYTKAR